MKLSIIFVVVVTVVFIPHTTCAQEEIILSTYYPAPHGEYDQLMADTLLMDPGDDDADQKTLIGFFDNDSSHEHKLRITTAPTDTGDNIDSACIDLYGNDYVADQKAGDIDFFAGRGLPGGPYGDIGFYTSEHPTIAGQYIRMRIEPDGNFAIGGITIFTPRIDPDAMLTIGWADGSKYNVAIKGSAAGPKIFLDEWSGAISDYVETGVFGIDGADDAFLIKQITNSGTNALLLDVQTSTARNLVGSSLLSVLHDGNVGIGTDAPTASLHVTDPTIAIAPDVEGVQICGGATSAIEITSNAGGSFIDFTNLAEGAGTRDYDARLELDPDYDGVLAVSFDAGAADAAFVIDGFQLITEGLAIGTSNITGPVTVVNPGISTAPAIEGVQFGSYQFTWYGVEITTDGGNIAYIDFHNNTGSDYDGRILYALGVMSIWADSGTIQLSSPNTQFTSTLTVAGDAHFHDDVHVDGALSSDNPKPFVIDHPTKPGLELIHACIEGPEAGLYYRGDTELVNGQALIRLPEYFETLTRPEDRTVLLTAKGREPFLLSCTDIVDGKFTVYGTRPDGEFSWEVKAVRADIEPLVIERPKVPRKEVPEPPDFLTQQTPSSYEQ